MSLVDNRTQLQDCEAAADVSGDTTAAPTTLGSIVGTVIEGSNCIEFQMADAQEVLLFDQDAGGSTFSVDMSDMTIYMAIKYNLGELFGNIGGLIAFGDGADGAGGDIVGYAVNGADVAGFPYEFLYGIMKLDVSVVVASPGTEDVDYYIYQGTLETDLDHTAVLQIGYGSKGLVKAVSSAKNAWCDGIYYIANDSIALSIIGGSSGTPETMVDVAADDVTAGMAMINNPKGTEYGFFAPTEWGAATGDTYFTSDGEQWYFIGDNQGGHAIGATHFPMRLLGGTGTNSWVLTSTVMVNTGTRSQVDLSHASFNTATMEGCSMIGFDTIELPGGTTKTVLSTIFANCNTVTNNGGSMDGCTILDSIVDADTGSLVYNEAADPDGTLDNITFEMGANDHHAIDFGTAVDSSLTSITLRGCAFNGFGAVDDANASTVRFLATTGSLTLNLIDCTVDGISPVASGGSQNFSVDDAAGITVTVVVAPVTLLMTVTDRADDLPIENVQTSIHLADSPFTELMNEDTTASGIASESYAGSTPVDIVWKTRKSDDLDDPRYFAQSGKGEITTGGFTQAVLMEENTIIP